MTLLEWHFEHYYGFDNLINRDSEIDSLKKQVEDLHEVITKMNTEKDKLMNEHQKKIIAMEGTILKAEQVKVSIFCKSLGS